jgi:hypothetical protein
MTELFDQSIFVRAAINGVVKEGVIAAFAAFTNYYVCALALLALALATWAALLFSRLSSRTLAAGLCALMLGELLLFAYGRNPQSDPALYYPPLPVLQELSHRTPGRCLGIGCLPPNLIETCGLREIRGYDAVDPARILSVLNLARRGPDRSPSYARTLNYEPVLMLYAANPQVVPRQVVPRPVLSMLNLRYLIFPGSPPDSLRPLFKTDDYYVLENPAALPRAFVPRRVIVEPNGSNVLRKMASPDFESERVAYVDQPVSLSGDCTGAAEIAEDLPCRVKVRVETNQPGLLVLADQWYPGWTATVNGQPEPIQIANYALRGVVVPAGTSEVLFRYEPDGFTYGARLSIAAAVILLAWTVWIARRHAVHSPVADR